MRYYYGRKTKKGVLLTEMIVAISVLVILTSVLVPKILSDKQALRDLYYRSVAMEILDGEMEILLSGEWQNYKEGITNFTPRANALKILPKGIWRISLSNQSIKLEWIPHYNKRKLYIAREVKF